MKEKTWGIPYHAETWGIVEIKAKTKKKALELFLEGEGDYLDNKSNYDYEEKEIFEVR